MWYSFFASWVARGRFNRAEAAVSASDGVSPSSSRVCWPRAASAHRPSPARERRSAPTYRAAEPAASRDEAKARMPSASERRSVSAAGSAFSSAGSVSAASAPPKNFCARCAENYIKSIAPVESGSNSVSPDGMILQDDV